jgi:hypothetical protein
MSKTNQNPEIIDVTPKPLPPPTGYDSWLDYAVDCISSTDVKYASGSEIGIRSKAAARAELELLRDYKQFFVAERDERKQAQAEVESLRKEVAALREALKTLASSEAFSLPRAVQMPEDGELLLRMDFARNTLGKHEPPKESC